MLGKFQGTFAGSFCAIGKSNIWSCTYIRQIKPMTIQHAIVCPTIARGFLRYLCGVFLCNQILQMHRKGYTHYVRGFICDYPFPRTGFHTPSSALPHSPILNRLFSFSTPSSSPQRYFDPRGQLGLPQCAFRIHLLDNKSPR